MKKLVSQAAINKISKQLNKLNGIAELKSRNDQILMLKSSLKTLFSISDSAANEIINVNRADLEYAYYIKGNIKFATFITNDNNAYMITIALQNL